MQELYSIRHGATQSCTNDKSLERLIFAPVRATGQRGSKFRGFYGDPYHWRTTRGESKHWLVLKNAGDKTLTHGIFSDSAVLSTVSSRVRAKQLLRCINSAIFETWWNFASLLAMIIIIMRKIAVRDAKICDTLLNEIPTIFPKLIRWTLSTMSYLETVKSSFWKKIYHKSYFKVSQNILG